MSAVIELGVDPSRETVLSSCVFSAVKLLFSVETVLLADVIVVSAACLAISVLFLRT